jgi:hypothetical protein
MLLHVFLCCYRMLLAACCRLARQLLMQQRG